MNEEKASTQSQLSESKELIKSLRKHASTNETQIEKLKQNIDDLNVFKEKYERLQGQAILMKERYEGRIKELLDADPDPEIIEEEVKKVMNVLYRKLKTQIKSGEYYAGNGILTGLLKIIKIATMLVLHSEESLDESQAEEDFFSQHVYRLSENVKLEDAPKVNVDVKLLNDDQSKNEMESKHLVKESSVLVNDVTANIEIDNSEAVAAAEAEAEAPSFGKTVEVNENKKAFTNG